MDTQQQPAVSPTESASHSQTALFVAMIAAIVAQIALLDAAVETFLGGSPMRWWVASAVILFVALCVWLWRPGGWMARRSGWPGAAAASVGALIALLAASAWGPGGLEQGIRIAGQPTAVALSMLSICAVIVSAAVVRRTRSLPLWFRLAAAALAAYAFAALVLGIVAATPYSALFHGAGFWTWLPAWLQGPFVGAVVVLPLGAVALLLSWLKSRREPAARPGRLRPAVLLIGGFAASLAAIVTGGGSASISSTSPGIVGGPADFPWRSAAVAPAATEEERRAAIEHAAAQFQHARTVASELRASPIGLDEALEKIGRDPATLSQWIQQHIAFEPYEGFMKGPQGALVSGRANSADKALLLAELLKRTGASVQLVRGTLPVEQQPKAGLPEDARKPPTGAQVDELAKRIGMDAASLRAALGSAQVRHEKLVENIWTRTDRDVGAVVGALTAARVGAPTSVAWQAPAEHWWVRTDKGDLDPTLGQPGGAETATYALDGIPADRFHAVAIRVRVAKGSKEKTFLDRSFRSADLFGQTVAVANAPVGFGKSLTGGGKLTAQSVFAAAGATTEFQPQVIIAGKTLRGDTFDLDGNKVARKGGGKAGTAGDMGGGMGGLFGGLTGGEGDEEKSKSSGKLTVTAAYLEIELTAPGAAQPVRIRRNILRPDSTGRQRVLDLLAVREILVMPDEITADFLNNAVLEYADAWRKWIGEHSLTDYDPRKLSDYQGQPYFDPTLYGFGMLRQGQLRRLSETRLGKAQWVHPRPTVVSYVRRLVDGGRPTMVAGIDILENTVLPLGAVSGDWRRQFAFAAGMLDTALEHEMAAGPGIHSNTSVYLEQALMKGQQPVAVQGSLPRDLRLSAAARDQIQQQLGGAAVVLVPQEPASWYRVDLATGAALGYVEGGGGQEEVEYAAEIMAMDIEMYSTFKFWADLFKCIAMGVEGPLAGIDGLESLEECFKLMCGSVSGVVGKLTGWEGLLSAGTGFMVDLYYGEICQKIWNTMTGKKDPPKDDNKGGAK